MTFFPGKQKKMPLVLLPSRHYPSSFPCRSSAPSSLVSAMFTLPHLSLRTDTASHLLFVTENISRDHFGRV